MTAALSTAAGAGHALQATAGHGLAAGLDPNSVSPGLLGFIVVVIIGVITWFLARSMAKQLRKLDAGRAEQQVNEHQEQSKPDASQTHPTDQTHGPQPNGAH